MFDIFDVSQNFMINDARSTAKKRGLFAQIMIFLCVMTVASMIVSAITMLPTFIWVVFDSGLKDLLTKSFETGVLDANELLALMPEWLTVVSLFATAGEIIAPMMYCRLIERRSFASMGFRRYKAVSSYLIGYLAGAVMITAAAAICIMMGAIDVKFASSVSVLMILLYFVAYLVQGMAEETLMRGYLMTSIAASSTSRYAAAIAVGINSGLFSLLHLGNAGISGLSLLNLALAGIFFSLYVLRADNIWGAAAAHSAWNFVQGPILGIEVSGNITQSTVFVANAAEGLEWLSGGAFGLEGGMAVTIVLLIAILAVTALPKQKARG